MVRLSLLLGACLAAAAVSVDAKGIPVKNCVPVSEKHSVFNKEVCHRVGLEPCKAEHGMKVEFHNGLDQSKSPECFHAMSLLQIAFTCEEKHPSRFLFYNTEEQRGEVHLCQDLCQHMFKSCSSRAKGEFAFLQGKAASTKFCKSLQTKKSTVTFEVPEKNGHCMSLADLELSVIPASSSDYAQKVAETTRFAQAPGHTTGKEHVADIRMADVHNVGAGAWFAFKLSLGIFLFLFVLVVICPLLPLGRLLGRPFITPRIEIHDAEIEEEIHSGILLVHDANAPGQPAGTMTFKQVFAELVVDKKRRPLLRLFAGVSRNTSYVLGMELKEDVDAILSGTGLPEPARGSTEESAARFLLKPKAIERADKVLYLNETEVLLFQANDANDCQNWVKSIIGLRPQHFNIRAP